MKVLAVFGASLVLVLGVTPLVRTLALKFGYVAHPSEDRWHKVPTALLGGVAICVAYVIPLLYFIPDAPMLWVLLLGSGLIFSIGLFDDLFHLQPYSKLLGQIGVACIVIANGILIGPSSTPIFSIFLTLVWIVGVTNAFNLLDNMDGLSAGIACIASFCLFLAGMATGNTLMALLAACLCGTTLGFLWFNFSPAKIFMGDSGSLFLGFTLATVSITGTWEQASNLFLALLVPVLVLAVPIFDTTFVALARFFNGRGISQGGRDHTSHRLVAFGLPERTTVLLFYSISMFCGVMALIGLKYDAVYMAVFGIVVGIALLYFGLFLSGVIVYGEQAATFKKKPSSVVLDLFLMEKKRIGEMLIDCILIGLAFTLAFIIRFDGLEPFYAGVIAQSLPILIPLKLGTFYYFGLYRGLWRYVGIQDLINILKAVTLSSLLAVVVVTMAFRFEGYSRAVFVIDWMVLLLGVSGVRVSIRLIREYLNAWVQRSGKRLLIVGAGDAGEIALREINNNPKFGYLPLGFVDDDQQKVGRRIHGIPVLGTRSSLPAVCDNLQIEEILVAIPSANRTELAQILRGCRETGLKVQIMPRTFDLAGLESAHHGLRLRKSQQQNFSS